MQENDMLLQEIERQRLEIATLRQEKDHLATQVVRLVKAESKLYHYQEQLDAQLLEYQDLHELNRRLSTAFDPGTIFAYATEYILKLGYERILFFQRFERSGDYSVCATDGYFDADEKSAVLKLVLSPHEEVLRPLFSGAEFLISRFRESSPQLADFGGRILMDEYLLYPLGSAEQVAALVAVGNSAQKAQFHRRVSERDGGLLGLGNVVGVISSTLDTWEALEKKRLAEAKYLSIFENASEGIFQSIPDGRFISCNPATAAILGYPSPEAVIEGVRDIASQLYVHPLRRVELYQKMARGMEIRNFEAEFYRRDGSILWVSISSRPHLDAQGRLVHVDGILQDITERKEAEKEIRCLNIELEKRVNLRTAQLEESYREQEAFNYSVSHDLRAPLRHINSYSAILIEELRDELPDTALHYLQRICAASSSMGNLIDDLLALSKVGRGELKFSVVDMNEIAQGVVAMLRETEPWRFVRFQAADGLKVRGDYNLVKMVLQNLIGNAWKYTSKKPEARIEFGKTPINGETAFFIRDNGVGFDMSYYGKLFGAFQRLHGAEFDGCGIGLATVQRIINRHNSRVWAESEVGQGATFYFTLPETTRNVARG